MPKLYSIDIPVYATAYIKADSAEEAQAIARNLQGAYIEVPAIRSDEIEISELMYGDPDLPDVSLSPAMTIGIVGAGVVEEASRQQRRRPYQTSNGDSQC